MRFLREAALLAPLLVQARSIPQAVDVDDALAAVPDYENRASFTAFELPCQADDESFSFTFDLQEPFQDAACGYSNLIVNGQPLPQEWRFDAWDWSGQGRSSISIESSLNSRNHTLQLSTRSVCETSSIVGSSESPEPVVDGQSGVLEITHVKIESIDGRPSNADAGFTIVFHQPTLRIVETLLTPDPSRHQLADILAHPSRGPSADSDDTSTRSDKELQQLEYLEQELQILGRIVDKQRNLVDDIARTNRPPFKEEIHQCKDVKCVVGTVYHHMKDCLRLFTARLHAVKDQEIPGSRQESGCYWSHSRVARMKALDDGQDLCPPKNLPVKHPEKNNSSSSSSLASFDTNAGLREDTLHSVLVPISFVACFLCLGCLTVKLHRSCCNPRARAERAARREERVTRFQYRRLARRQAWRKWWNERVLRNQEPSSSNYEEKRSLIRAQEAILERAAQDEIRRLCGDHSAAEEGRAMSQCDTLPEYRSRAGSGSPPSYNGGDDAASSTSPGGSPRSYTPAGSDMTPDSSVAAISPRHSSETLRSQFSLV